MTESSGFSQSSEMERRVLPPERSRRAIWPWLVLAAGLVVVLIWRSGSKQAGGDAEASAHPAIGTRLTRFHLVPLTGDGQETNLDDLAGKVTLINFWGPWCGACVVEFPYLMEIEKHFRPQADFQFFSISSNYDPRDTAGLAESTERFLKQRRADFPTYRDPDAATTIGLIRAAKIENFGYPTTVLLDRDGVIRGLWSGFSPGDERQIRQLIDTTLQDRASPAG